MKDIKEKAAIPCINQKIGKAQEEVDEDDILCLEEEYKEDDDEKGVMESDELNNNHSYSCDSEEKNLCNNVQADSKVTHKAHDSNFLVLKENIDEIKTFLEKMKSELLYKEQKRTDLTVKELVISLLKPQLSEWLNNYLYGVVKEIVEKELKDIITNK